MQFKKLIALSSVLLFLCLNLFISGVDAAENNEEQSRVTTTFTITFGTGTNLTIDIAIDVQQITTDKTYTKQDIINLSTLHDDQSLQELGALRYAVYQILKDELKNTFPNATLLNFAMPAYQNGNFVELLNAKLSSGFFQLDSSAQVDEFINGVLDMDAIVSYVFDFQATEGWNNSYMVTLPDSLIFRNTTGSVYGNQIHWTLDNWNGQHPTKRGRLSLQAVHPTTPKSTQENISLVFGLDTSRVQTTSLQTTVAIHSINISTYAIIPSSITNLMIIPADGIRLFTKNDLLSWDDLQENTMKTIEQAILSSLQNSAFNQTLNLVFAWDPTTTQNCTTPYTITKMNATPPITATWTDSNVELKIFNLSSRAIFGLATAGAQADVTADDINFGTNFNILNHSFSCVLTLPTHVYLNGKNPYQWNKSTPFFGAMNSDISPTYSEEQKHSTITIELSKMDLNIPSFITGKTELTAPVYTKEELDFTITRLPSEFSLPDTIYLDFMNADAFRLCVEEHVFTSEQIETFSTNQKQKFEEKISNILHRENIVGYSDLNRFNSSLQWDKDIAKMDANTPVIVSSYAHCLHAVPFNLSFWMPSFNICDQHFTLTGAEDQDVTYRIIFPTGITVTATDSLGKTIVKGETEKRQQYLEITFTPQEALDGDVLSCTLTASSMYVLALFLPCILSIILAVILIIIIYLINKKRRSRGISRVRRRRPRREIIQEEEEQLDEQPSDQDFYVPPPPSSRR